MGKKRIKKEEEELIPEETVPVESEDATAASRDFDAERKDEEVMKDEEIPAANADKLWHHLSPKNVMAADAELLHRTNVLFMALKGYGVSHVLYGKLPKEVRSLFNDEPLSNEDWAPDENF